MLRKLNHERHCTLATLNKKGPTPEANHPVAASNKSYMIDVCTQNSGKSEFMLLFDCPTYLLSP